MLGMLFCTGLNAINASQNNNFSFSFGYFSNIFPTYYNIVKSLLCLLMEFIYNLAKPRAKQADCQ